MADSDQQDFNSMSTKSLSALRTLLTPLLEFAKEQLAKYGAFLPFGAVIDEQTCVSLVTRDDHSDCSGEEGVQRLAAVLQHRVASGNVSAAAVCFYCMVVPPGAKVESDAVCFHFEDARKERWNLFFPFVGGGSKEVTYQPWHYERGEQWIFRET